MVLIDTLITMPFKDLDKKKEYMSRYFKTEKSKQKKKIYYVKNSQVKNY